VVIKIDNEMEKQDTEIIARKAFADIAALFPQLKIVVDECVAVELSFTIPEQSGLKQKIWLGLQNHDELSFGVGHFQVEWFPCTDTAKVSSYIGAVTGFVSGKYRILEQYRGTKCVKAELQEPTKDGWHTIATYSLAFHLVYWLPFPRKTFREARNNQ